MKREWIYLLCVWVMCSFCVPAWSWGQKGHRIIAKIACDNLSRKAKVKVERFSGQALFSASLCNGQALFRGESLAGKALFRGEGIIYFANWSDEIKSDTIYPTSYDWHFQDFDGGMSDSAIIATLTDYPKAGGNLFRAMDELVSRLQNKGQREEAESIIPDMPEEDMLKFIVHLMGDRYCPMHTAHMDDRGGNDVKVQWFGKDTNLHSIWDAELIESQGYSYTEYAEFLEHKYGMQKKAIMAMSREELLLRNYHLTEAIYAYQETWDGNPYHYIYHWHEAMEEQLYIAGIRLAKLLNEIYK